MCNKALTGFTGLCTLDRHERLVVEMQHVWKENRLRRRRQRAAVRCLFRVAGGVGLSVVLTLTTARADPSAVREPSASSPPIPRPAGLDSQIAFWKKVFATYSTHQVVIHDALHLDRVYAVLDFRPMVDAELGDATIEAYARDKVREEKERIRAMLLHLHQLGPHPVELSEDERKLWSLFGKVKKPAELLHAAAEDRIRAQAGLRERFAAGVEVSRRYLPQMEAIFRREGLPVELTRLPLVESCFNVRAYSKAGAAGIWQFMPATGQLYLRIDDAVDERRDPIASTVAAARHLKANYERLGSWPLAVTAYNHGRAGIARAVAQVGSTDLVEIIKRYKGPTFKFASRNFYAEFLAALEVEREFTRHFGELRPHPPLQAETVVLPDYVRFRSLVEAAGTDADALARLNPALSTAVLSGKLRVPKGYALRLPAGTADRFRARYASLPASHKFNGQLALYITHRVQKGQTLSAIAKRYGTTVVAIQRRNRLKRSSHVRAGQSLVIPKG